MDTIGDFTAWASTSTGVLSIVAVILLAVVSAAVWSFVSYRRLKGRELQRERFIIYHELISELVQPDSLGQSEAMDRQIAVVSELRNFDEYFDVTLRVLEGLQEACSAPGFVRLTNEIAYTIDYIISNSKLQPENKGHRTTP